MKDNIRFGIIGCGMISRAHADSIKAIPDAELVGVFDLDSKRCRAFAGEYGVTAFESMEALLSSTVEAVCICTPSGFHGDNGLRVMEAGRHVLIEKPVALNTGDCDRLIEGAEKYGVRAGVISQLRFSETIRTARDLVKNGALGRVVTADLLMKYHRSPDYFAGSSWRGTWKYDGGGALMNQGIHGIDLLLHLMGRARMVYGMARTLAHSIEVEDTAAAVVEFETGALGLIQGTTSVSPGSPRVLTISGTKGTIGITEDRFTEWGIMGSECPESIRSGKEIRSGASDPGNISYDGHRRQILDFMDAIRSGRAPMVTLEDGKRTVELITAIYASSRSNIAIQLS